jgi:erythromycin esterase-like protein
MRRVAILMMLLLIHGVIAGQGAVESEQESLVESIEEIAYELTNTGEDIDRILDLIGDDRIVLIGESTHGTHEFYQMRAQITQALIEQKGFTGVAIEGRWTDAYRVNRYVRGEGSDHSAEAALSSFEDFPRWMWRNTDVRNFVEWLRFYNTRNDADAGFYGLDLYGVYPSIEAVTAYVEAVDEESAAEVTTLYACFEGYGTDLFDYGAVASSASEKSCADEAETVLSMLEENPATDEAYFNAVQNARVVVNGESYYRLSFEGVNTWNVRDQHMMETLQALDAHLSANENAKLVVWAHNSHVGDARATDMSLRGEHNIGQLAREQYGDDAFLIGFTTYVGSVMAAQAWDMPGQLREVQPGMAQSYEALFHAVEMPDFLLSLEEEHPVVESLKEPRLQRAIGVIYRPETERQSHYFHARIAEQFDLVIHLDETQAVQPLDAAGFAANRVVLPARNSNRPVAE